MKKINEGKITKSHISALTTPTTHHSGITLIALVVTVVVLLILAGITIQLIFGENSIFESTQKAVNEHKETQVEERISTALLNLQIRKKAQGGTITPEECFNELKKQGIIEDSTIGGENVKELEPDENGNKRYEVTTDESDKVIITITPEGKVEVEYQSGGQGNQGNKDVVKVDSIEVTSKNSNSITVEVTVSKLEKGKVSYYYKKEDETEYHELTGKQNTTDLTATFAGLEQGKVYNIKVVATSNGKTSELVINELTGELAKGTISQKGETTWTNKKGSIELETTETGVTIQYQVGGIDEDKWKTYTDKIDDLEHENTVYVRLWDGTNGSEESAIEIRDGKNPTATIGTMPSNAIVGETITVAVTNTDNESGINVGECKWIFTTSSSKIGTEASSYTGTFTSTSQNVTWSTTTPGTYYLHVLSVDVAGNKQETVSTSGTVVSYQLATGVTVSPTTAELETGSTQQLTATVTPNTTQNKAVTWSSNNEAVATVSTTGLVTAKAVGNATITVKTDDGSNRTATCSITVKSATATVGPNGKPLPGTITTINNSKNTEAEDIYGNPITIPAGFKVVPNGGTDNASKVTYSYNGDGTPAVQDGIVIQDNSGNQFVWVPVGTIKNKEGDTVHGETSTITLGRYDNFTANNKVYTPKQIAETQYKGTSTGASTDLAYQKAYKIILSNYDSYYTMELNTKQSGKNEVAKNLGDFITKTIANGGYYIARYEASGKTGGTVTSKANQTVWNEVNQATASSKSQSMYSSTNGKFETDLINSYSWDTAIIFIQTYSDENNNYAEQGEEGDSPLSTGTSTDGACNIHDMASNCFEWSTEYSDCTGYRGASPCVVRGVGCDSSYATTAFRQPFYADFTDTSISFRPILYCSTEP